MDNEVDDRVAFGGGVLRVTADIQVQPCAVLQEDVAAATPGDDPAEEVPSDLVGRESALAAERARDAVLVLQAHDSPVHTASLFAVAANGRASGALSRQRLTASACTCWRFAYCAGRRQPRSSIAASKATAAER